MRCAAESTGSTVWAWSSTIRASISACCRSSVPAWGEHGLEELALDVLLARLGELGLVKAGGKQRTDSTHVISAVGDLNRLELAGESVRACLEAIAAASPGWLATVVDVSDCNGRYGRRVDSWRLPTSKTRRAQLASAYGADAVALLEAVYSRRSRRPGCASCPPWMCYGWC